MSSKRVLGVLGGEDMPLELLQRWAESADIVVAADSGADRLRDLGIIPLATVGDLDSISSAARKTQDELVYFEDQETTDCDKLLAYVAGLGHSSITLASVEGNLLDHMLGTLSSAVASSLDVRLALRCGVGWVLKGQTTRRLVSTVGSRLSMMPMGEATGVTLTGVQWPIEDWVLQIGGRTSLSNRTTQPEVAVSQATGASLLFIEYGLEAMPFWEER